MIRLNVLCASCLRNTTTLVAHGIVQINVAFNLDDIN